MIRVLFDRRHWWLTLLVAATAAIMLALGVWQLGRLSERRAQNERTRAELAGPPLALNAVAPGTDLAAMEYRSVVMTGTYDFDREIALRNQRWGTRPGVHLLTPLRLAGNAQAVLVERGWIPMEDAAPERWAQYGVPTGAVIVRGLLRVPPAGSGFSLPEPAPAPGSRQTTWSRIALDRLAPQSPYPLLPVYVTLTPDPAWTALPFRPAPDIDLSDGSHLSYAVQWFTFATVTLAGYGVYLRRAAKEH